MQAKNADIIIQLQKDILSLQGFKPASAGVMPDVGLGAIETAFPNASFPIGAVHEFLCESAKDTAVTTGFIAGLLSALMRNGGACLWISSSTTLFPPALKYFGIEPDRVIFIDLQKENDLLWAMEEALKCGGLAAVVGEIYGISFTVSRRLQLAVEQSRVTGFIVHHNPRKLNITACVSRWKIKPLPSEVEEGLPGLGFPKWKVELLKVRNGKPGIWNVYWEAGRFRHITYKIAALPQELKTKTG